MLSVRSLAQLIRPDRTVLLLGAGASISSGAMTGAQLANTLASELSPRPDTSELEEVSGIWEARLGRRSLVEKIRTLLGPLGPSNALLSLPLYNWRNVYSTNFDRLVEKSYQSHRIPLNVVRSNFDFDGSQAESTTLYKIHGCVTQDISFGSNARMVLTERDYDLVEDYRQAIMKSLSFDSLTSDMLVLGQSLRDTHLRKLAKDAAHSRSASGTPGRTFVLVYERDEDRAGLLEQFGLQVAFGSLEEFFYELSQSAAPVLVSSSESTIGGVLPARMAAACVDVSHAALLPSDAVRLFNGVPASYSDIAGGLTAERGDEQRALQRQDSPNGFFTTLLGVAGVGKTTLARRVLYARHQQGFMCWEAQRSFVLDIEGWLEVERNLRQSGRQGFLLIDDCTSQMALVNQLATSLGRLDRPSLRLVLTANVGSWRARAKSPALFKRGSQVRLSRLTERDLNNLVNLVASVPHIHELVDPDFLLLNKQQQIERLRDRCSSEMFVCLKNIFGNDEIDFILLNEYAELNNPEQDVYRHVAVLQAMGARVHRQLVLRCLNIDAGQLESILVNLDGIVDEFDVLPSKGLYGWSVRHDVIAKIISQYKFAESGELFDLLARIIDGINPSILMEIETARSLCVNDWGIPRLASDDDQVDLIRKVIGALPAERIPRRRLIKKYLDMRNLGEAAQAIKSARSAVKSDMIVDRYEVKMFLYRSESDGNLLPEDRAAILFDALNKAKKLVDSNETNGQNIRVLADVAVAIARKTGDLDELYGAIERLQHAEDVLLDPEVTALRSRFEQSARNLAATTAGMGVGDEQPEAVAAEIGAE